MLSTRSQTLSVDATTIAKLSLADFQNAVPLIRELAVVSTLATDSGPLELTLSSEPAFFKGKTWRLDSVARDQRYRIKDLDIALDGPLLTRLTEAEAATVKFTLRKAGEEKDAVAELSRQVDLLPRNQWGGISHLPDMVAAFVQPNDPAVDKILKKAAELLRVHGKSASLDGYTKGSKRAWELTSAVWGAIVSMKIDYALPPASFEQAGQKIRGATQIADSGLATCMDLSLLFCSCLEQAGLNPVVVFTKGHAFAGVWLKAEEFSASVIDDITALRKRLRLKELVLFETTLVTQRPPVSFSRATEVGADHIGDAQAEAFELAVDIRRARLQRIKPLASQDVIKSEVTTDIEQDDKVILEEAPDLPEDGAAPNEVATLDPKDRLARWQRKLLDLSLRNNLLNFKGGKRALKLDAPNPGALEDLMADGKEIKLLARPELMDGRDPRNMVIHEGRDRENLRRQFAIDALKRREVLIELPSEEMDGRLVDLYRTARSNLQEGGANTLFMALGFLNWNRVDKEGQKFRAPLILVPVTLSRRSVRSGFTLTVLDDEPRFNPTLIEMLRQDFQLNLGISDGELPRDEAGLDIDRVWKSVSSAIKDVKGWEVSEEVILSTFSFAKYLMWVDLVQRTDQLRLSPVVKHLIDTPRDPYPSTARFPEARSLDREYRPEQTFCPLPADSSQLSAVMAAAKGKDFVLIGPPGTGKSQTISNLIAQCLAEGKRILFVSEKIAALDVVYRRLREVGLGEFCLELHSSKARKADILAQLKASWDSKGQVDTAAWQQEAVNLKRLRDELNGYVERLHHRHSNGRSIYEAIGVVVSGCNVPALPMCWPTHSAHSDSDTALLRGVVDRLGVNAAAVGLDSLANSPLVDIGESDWSPTWQQSLIDAARQLLPVVEAIVDAHKQFQTVTNLPNNALGHRSRIAVASLARSLPNAAGKDWRFAFASNAQSLTARLLEGAALLDEHARFTGQLSPGWSGQTRSTAKKGLELLKERREIYSALPEPWPVFSTDILRQGLHLLERIQNKERSLSVGYSDGIEQINVYQLQRDFGKADKALWPMSWLGKRKVRRAMEALVTGQGEPKVFEDLNAWVSIRDLRSEVVKLDVDSSVSDVWAGLKTRIEVLRAALHLQGVLKSARANVACEFGKLELLSAGRGGDRLAKAVSSLERIRELDSHILTLDCLAEETHQIWKGIGTDIGLLQEALAFMAQLEDIRDCGKLGLTFGQIAEGRGGDTPLNDFEILRQRSVVEANIDALNDLKVSCPSIWNGLNTARKEIDGAASFQRSIASAVAILADGSEGIAAIYGVLERLVTEGNSLLETAGPVPQTGDLYLEALGRLQPSIDILSRLGSFNTEVESSFVSLGLHEIKVRCEAIISAGPKLNSWCAWRKVKQQASTVGLTPLVVGLEAGSVPPNDVQQAFETNYCRWWLNSVVDCEPTIRTFVSAEHEKRIADFRSLDERFNKLTKAWLRARLCGGLPSQDEVTRSSEWGFLRHEITKKRAHKPLRELMSNIPTALTKLTPCLLMSPISIAQYLAPDAEPFDLVVFDEASQISVWDAIGAIARGKQVVMVGDPKQLPPTSFFDRAESQIDDEDVEADLESILDECIGASLPTLNLSWHYRSRSESLIAFSNHRYYGGGLVTFPSPVTEDRAVSFHHVNGIYEKGGARINKAEAKAVVADIVRRLKTPNFSASKLTIGVVTFNSEQQKLIEDLLDEERRKDASIEHHFSDSLLEPIFVKNLESVQGDERDIMYFSITYGPDSSGAVSMNFGPMNREGGERRLNVAITRARQEFRVFSSLRAEQMDLSRTQAAGVRDLKHFLEFAERGPRALAEATAGSLGGFESPFEEAVAGELSSKGWTIHTQVGASAFRIDLAVVHPDAAGSYLCGIECDGATYHRSATAKDRDMLREHVLRGLGWEVLRIWSTDWWVDSKGTAEKVHAKLNALLETDRERRFLMAERLDADIKAESAIEQAMAIGSGDNSSEQQPSSSPSSHQRSTTTGEAGHVPESAYANEFALRSSGTLSDGSVYVEADPLAVVPNPNADTFFDLAYDASLRAMISHVVSVEGPILDMVLARRISKAHGWQRAGRRIQEKVEAIARSAFKTTDEEGVGTFYWPSSIQPGQCVDFRATGAEVLRSVDEVCIEELFSLVDLTAPDAASDEELLVAMARELGVRRLGSAVRARLEHAIALWRGRS